MTYENFVNQVFLFATNQISTNKIPLIHQVIPISNVITTALEDHIEKDTLPLVVHHAALRGYDMLNKYYTLTDDSIVYRIAMSRSFTVLLDSFKSCLLIYLFSSSSSLQAYLFCLCEVATGMDNQC